MTLERKTVVVQRHHYHLNSLWVFLFPSTFFFCHIFCLHANIVTNWIEASPETKSHNMGSYFSCLPGGASPTRESESHESPPSQSIWIFPIAISRYAFSLSPGNLKWFIGRAETVGWNHQWWFSLHLMRKEPEKKKGNWRENFQKENQIYKLQCSVAKQKSLLQNVLG